MQNLQNETTEPVDDGADGSCVLQAWDEAPIKLSRKWCLGLDCSVRCLIEDASHLAIALGGSGGCSSRRRSPRCAGRPPRRSAGGPGAIDDVLTARVRTPAARIRVRPVMCRATVVSSVGLPWHALSIAGQSRAPSCSFARPVAKLVPDGPPTFAYVANRVSYVMLLLRRPFSRYTSLGNFNDVLDSDRLRPEAFSWRTPDRLSEITQATRVRHLGDPACSFMRAPRRTFTRL